MNSAPFFVGFLLGGVVALACQATPGRLRRWRVAKGRKLVRTYQNPQHARDLYPSLPRLHPDKIEGFLLELTKWEAELEREEQAAGPARPPVFSCPIPEKRTRKQ